MLILLSKHCRYFSRIDIGLTDQACVIYIEGLSQVTCLEETFIFHMVLYVERLCIIPISHISQSAPCRFWRLFLLPLQCWQFSSLVPPPPGGIVDPNAVAGGLGNQTNNSCELYCNSSAGELWTALKSVKRYPGGRKIDLISSISDIQSQTWYHCIQYTERHHMSLFSYC